MRRAVRLTVVVVAALVVAFGLATPPALAVDPSPPGQPATGPGGASYQWSGANVVFHSFYPYVDLDYWTYEPVGWTGGGAAPTSAPTVVFVHGYTANDPSYYGNWLWHLARKGNVIIFPRYQTTYTSSLYFTSNAIWSVKDAFNWLSYWPAVKPDLSKGMTLVSHSWGGPVSANIANRYASEGLPTPKALMFAEPFNSNVDASRSGIPSTTKIDCVVGHNDTVVGRNGCDLIWDRTGHIPSSNRNYVWMFTDTYGYPDLVADHFVPSGTTALNYFGFWKLADAVRDCSVFGANCSYALGNTVQQRYMGAWSDGHAVTELQVTTTKPPCPPGTTAVGC
jgi:hypothetical protein